MKQFFKMFFASLLAMIVAGVIIFGITIGLIVGLANKAVSTETEDTKSGSVLVIDMKKLYHERGETNSLAAFTDDDDYMAGIYETVKSVRHAAEDDKIKGILIKCAPSPNNWATLQQLRDAVLEFKTSKKFVYAYGEIITQDAYYVASAADSVFLNPVGDMEFKGLATQLAFFKGTLDKLGIEPEIFYAGKFKSATEPFRATQISEANEQQIREFQQDFWTEFLQAASMHTGADTATVHQWAATGAVQFPEDAYRLKLVDGLLYWDEVETRLRKQTDIDDEDEKISYENLSDYARNVRGDRDIKDTRIAVLYAEGAIVDGEGNDGYQIASKEITELIRKIKKDDKIKAVVLRVNSPGGSALASEVILRELQLLRERKPLVVSMGDFAASGGYYISCQADSIFALPNTITGSIGVFTMLFSVEQMMNNKLGVTFDEVKNAPYADFPTLLRPLNSDEQGRMQASVDTIYEVFKRRVATGRKMTVANVDSIAQGRVWSGKTAKRIGLVDDIGDIDRALVSAASLADVEDYYVVTYPEPLDRFNLMLKQFGGVESATAKAVKQMMENEMSEEYKWYKQLKQLQNINGRAMMLMPFDMNVR